MVLNAVTKPFRELFRHREIILDLSRREVWGRYKGQPLGAVWAFIHPAVLMGLYIFLFGMVFRTNEGFSETMPLPYAAYILSGMVPWLFIQTCLANGPDTIVSNSAVVKQVIFPVLAFPAKAVGSALIIEIIYLAATTAYTLVSCLAAGRFLPWTYLLLPCALLLQIMLMLGLCFLLSALTPYLRDLKDIVLVFATFGVYLAPIVYLPGAVPALFKPLLYINPFSYVIWMFQDTLYFGSVAHGYAWLVSAALALICFYGGYAVFNRLKLSFGSVV